MNKTTHIDNYRKLFDDLRVMVQSTEKKILNSEDYFLNNANFFTKSFIVTMCAYLESYLKDVLMLFIDNVNNRLLKNQVPYNLVKWSLSSDKKKEDKDSKFEHFCIDIDRKELDDYISGNPFRTATLFSKFGIDLNGNGVFQEQKDKLNAIIGKRNNIIHHNDEASDISLRDISEHIEFFVSYIENIDSLIVQHTKQ